MVTSRTPAPDFGVVTLPLAADPDDAPAYPDYATTQVDLHFPGLRLHAR